MNQLFLSFRFCRTQGTDALYSLRLILVSMLLSTCIRVSLFTKQHNLGTTHKNGRKKLWYIYTTEYYSSTKRNTVGSVLMRWMNLEPIMQSEVSQKGKDKYRIVYIWNLERWYQWIYWQGSNGETDTENRLVDVGQGKERVRCMDRVTGNSHHHMQKRQPGRICCRPWGIQTGALYQPRGTGWGGRWEAGSRRRWHMHTNGSFMLMFDRKQQNSVKQLSFN